LFKIDIETCEQCGDVVQVITYIEDPVVVKRILDHLANRKKFTRVRVHTTRAPPPGIRPDGS